MCRGENDAKTSQKRAKLGLVEMKQLGKKRSIQKKFLKNQTSNKKNSRSPRSRRDWKRVEDGNDVLLFVLSETKLARR